MDLEKTVAISIEEYMDLIRHIGEMEGILMAARTYLKNNEDFRIEAIDEVFKRKPTINAKVNKGE